MNVGSGEFYINGQKVQFTYPIPEIKVTPAPDNDKDDDSVLSFKITGTLSFPEERILMTKIKHDLSNCDLTAISRMSYVEQTFYIIDKYTYCPWYEKGFYKYDHKNKYKGTVINNGRQR